MRVAALAGHGLLLLLLGNSAEAHTSAPVATTIDADWLYCLLCSSGGSVA